MATPSQDSARRDDNDGLDAEERQQEQYEEYLAEVRRRADAYEGCVDAIGVICASLEELSGKVEQMKVATQQLNAFTSGWLAVWKRAA